MESSSRSFGRIDYGIPVVAESRCILVVVFSSCGKNSDELVKCLAAALDWFQKVTRHDEKIVTVEPIGDEEIGGVPLTSTEREMNGVLCASVRDDILPSFDLDLDLASKRVVGTPNQ